MTQEELRRLVEYCPRTGQFFWKVATGSGSPGKAAGCLCSDGYVRIKVRKLYLASRLAWFYMTGEWPKEQIDHKNGIKHDNSWRNLREATAGQNIANRGKQSNNRSGFKGVHFCNRNKKWIARIGRDGATHYIGSFDDLEMAARAYADALPRYHGKFARLS